MIRESVYRTDTIATIVAPPNEIGEELDKYFKTYPEAGYMTKIRSFTEEQIDGVVMRVAKVWRINNCD